MTLTNPCAIAIPSSSSSSSSCASTFASPSSSSRSQSALCAKLKAHAKRVMLIGVEPPDRTVSYICHTRIQ
ncbi:hypothetical protein L6164_002353 [Bauhinia variegata]|uniref:Uncharacterized protein n=1 Tax=Bauhinia variegata TaxID=167791 RepID=A0ACB9PYG3_BAUVA|nr:hypothetical protein L6164_002353 [Bauhinia variegata]